MDRTQALAAATLGSARVATTKAELPPAGPVTPAVQRLHLVALRLFAEKGFHGATVRDIAGELGVKAASLYSLVESKEQLLADLIYIGHNAHALAIDQALEAAGSDPADRLAAFVDAHVRFHARWPMLAVVANTELHCLPDELAAPSLEIRGRTAGTLQQILERGKRQRRFVVRDTFLAAAAIAAMGMRVATWFAGGEHTEEDVAQEYAALALRSVGCDA